MQTFSHIKFRSKFEEFIKEPKNLLIAISSGQDSLCLLQLIFDYLKKHPYSIEAIYIDHQWKNDSHHHTKHIINIMQAKKIALTIYQIKQLALSENIARQIRYKTFIKHARKKKCSIIITGHNKNDLLETLLHNIMRGTSLTGITNLTLFKQLSEDIALFRPLISFSKSEIAWFCRLFNLPIWSDITNYNLSIKRNRIRHELIPYLQNYFNPRIEHSLTKFIDLCQKENEYIKENTLKLYIRSSHKIILRLNFIQLHKQHSILKKRVIKLFFYYHFNKQINENLLHKLLILCKGQTIKKFFFNGLKIYYYYGQMYIKHQSIS